MLDRGPGLGTVKPGTGRDDEPGLTGLENKLPFSFKTVDRTGSGTRFVTDRVKTDREQEPLPPVLRAVTGQVMRPKLSRSYSSCGKRLYFISSGL